MDEAARGQAGGGNAAVDPEFIYFREEATDLAPASSLAAFAGFAYQDDEEVQTVTRGFHHTVWGRAYKVAEGGEDWRRMAAGSASVCGVMVRTTAPAIP
jgi:hypothetical protein